MPRNGNSSNGAGKAGRAGAERVDIIEQADRASDIAGGAHQMIDQNRQGRAHQQRWHEDESERHRGGLRQAQSAGELSDFVEQRQ